MKNIGQQSTLYDSPLPFWVAKTLQETKKGLKEVLSVDRSIEVSIYLQHTGNQVVCNGRTWNLKPPQFIKVALQINVITWAGSIAHAAVHFHYQTTILAFWEAVVILFIDQITGKDKTAMSSFRQ